MALKYETMTEEGRRADRLDRYRWREGWERDTIERRFCYTTATVVALAMEEQEVSVLKVVAADFAGKDAVLQGMRRTATDLQKVYLQLETSSKYGFNGQWWSWCSRALTSSRWAREQGIEFILK
jgi:hypothetical protein